MCKMETLDTTHVNQSTDDAASSPNERLRSSNASSSSSTTRSSEFEDFVPLDPSELPGKNSSKDPEEDEEETREPDSGPTLESPPVQTMERPAGGSRYRIPSSVFARDRPGNPMEWSSVSNESLFSINTGNMSFTGEQFNWLEKSGELYRSGEFDLPSTPEVPTSPERDDLQLPEPSNPDPVGSSPDHRDNNSPSEVASIPENQDVATNTGNDRRARPARRGEKGTPASSRSNASGQSFEFPLLEGGFERGGSSVKSSGLGTLPEKVGSQRKAAPDSNEAHPVSPEAENVATCPWFSNCMSCFSRCVKTEKEGHGSKE